MLCIDFYSSQIIKLYHHFNIHIDLSNTTLLKIVIHYVNLNHFRLGLNFVAFTLSRERGIPTLLFISVFKIWCLEWRTYFLANVLISQIYNNNINSDAYYGLLFGTSFL